MNNRERDFQMIQTASKGRLVSSFSSYSNNRSLLTFLCAGCNQPYKTTGYLYTKSNNGSSCFECRATSDKSARDAFIQNCENVHGKYYDYKLVPEDAISSTPITIICPKHGNIETTITKHIDELHGCNHCQVSNTTSVVASSGGNFIIQANTVHNFQYRYDDVEYVNNNTPVTISCPKHGQYEQLPDIHLSGVGCSICTTTSNPIKQILHTLDQLGIAYSTEKTFPGCTSVNNRALRFDIYIPQKNLCIEYDGIHHFQPTKYSNSVSDKTADNYFLIQQENDKIKDSYCTEHNINFIRIPYNEYHPDAIVSKYITELEDERFIYSWNNFEVDVRSMINYIKTFNYSKFAIYGISRGGLPFAVPISNHFDDSCEFGVVRFQRYDGDDKTAIIEIAHQTGDIPIFVVDDLISSGKTMRQVRDVLSQQYPSANIHPIVIFGDENKDNVFFIKKHPKEWIVFPYEV